MNLTDIASICTILSFFVTIFLAVKVVTLEQKVLQSGSDNKNINQTASGNRNTQIGKQ